MPFPTLRIVFPGVRVQLISYLDYSDKLVDLFDSYANKVTYDSTASIIELVETTNSILVNNVFNEKQRAYIV